MNEEDLNIVSGMLDKLTSLIHDYYNKNDIDNGYIDALEYEYKGLMIKYNTIYHLIESEKDKK
jgi:hypothetical protein